MRRVELRHEKDLEQLQNLKGNEYIFLKVYKSFFPCSISAVDLKKFKGTMDVDIEDVSCVRGVIKVPTGHSKRFIFTNIENSEILLPRKQLSAMKYQNIKSSFKIQSEKDLEYVSNNICNQNSIVLHLIDDIAIESFPIHFLKSYAGKVIIDGGNHYFYVKKELWEAFQANYQVVVKNLKLVYVDQFLSIKTKEDLQNLGQLKSGRVVANVCNDISNFSMDSICLENFVGSLIILGHNKKLQNIHIRSFDNTHGFISSINPVSDLKIYQLSFQNITGKHMGECREAGVILGKRGDVSKEALSHFMPGQILFSNCSVKSSLLPDSTFYGTFVGQSDDEMDFDNCYDFFVYSKNGVKIISFVGELKQNYLSSFYVNNMDKFYDDREYLNALRERRDDKKRQRILKGDHFYF